MTGIYPCCGRPAQRGPVQRALPQSGCTQQPHTPLTPPEAPTYCLDPNDTASIRQTHTVGLVHILLKHQDLIVKRMEAPPPDGTTLVDLYALGQDSEKPSSTTKASKMSL